MSFWNSWMCIGYRLATCDLRLALRPGGAVRASMSPARQGAIKTRIKSHLGFPSDPERKSQVASRSSSNVFPQLLPQFQPRPMDPRLHRAQREVEGGGDRLVALAQEVPEDHQRASFLVESGDRPLDGLLPLDPERLLRGAAP